MDEIDNAAEVLQLHFLLRGINPPVWRRILIRSDDTIADLHYILQIVFHWTDSHLHRFVIRGKDCGIGRSGCTVFGTDAHLSRLADFQFRPNARFLYGYDFRDLWQHQIRVERATSAQAGRIYPVCIAEARAAPPEDCGGPWAYMGMMDHQELGLPWDDLERNADVLQRVVNAKVHERAGDVLGDLEALRKAIERVKAYTAFRPDCFERGPSEPEAEAICRGQSCMEARTGGVKWRSLGRKFGHTHRNVPLSPLVFNGIRR